MNLFFIAADQIKKELIAAKAAADAGKESLFR
jgi:hypothetical protein